MKTYNVSFINQNLEMKVEENTTVAMACQEAGFPLDLVCGGRGTCGKCRVDVETTEGMSSVLACRTKITSDITIYILEDDFSKKPKILSHADEDFRFNPSLKKTYVEIKEIKKRKNEFLSGSSLHVLRKFSGMLNQKGLKGITFVEYGNEVIDVQEGDTSEYLYGAAVDIGTTTVVMYIYDMNTGKLLKTGSGLNAQVSSGADVISRISSGSSREGLIDLNGKIIYTLNNLADNAKIDVPHLDENLYNIVLCGNSTMQHLALGLRPDRLGLSPFTSITRDFVECFGYETGISCPERCRVVFLPLLGGFVGADTTAVLLAAGDSEKQRLIVDMGTNGEIAVGSGDGWYVASTACGPALEGGSIRCGMRGTTGAVEKFEITDEKIMIKVIGDTVPSGICGSGIIDVTAELLRNGIIDSTGRMLDSSEYSEKKPGSDLSSCLRYIDGINSFVIYENGENSVYINQKDIRQVQLAKSSICSGCLALLKLMSMEAAEIDEALVAGAFGNYINLENARYIGLLPKGLPGIRSMGNGAGKGTAMFLLDRDLRKKCRKIIQNTTHYELADDNYYAGIYMENMNF